MTFLCLSRRIRALGPWGLWRHYKRKIVRRWGQAPGRGKLLRPHTTDVFWRNAGGHTSMSPCILGLAFLIFQQQTCCPDPKQCWNQPASGGTEGTLQKCRFPWSPANKMVGNTQGLQQTPFLCSAAAAYFCCSTSTTHVKSSICPIPVKNLFWTIFLSTLLTSSCNAPPAIWIKLIQKTSVTT